MKSDRMLPAQTMIGEGRTITAIGADGVDGFLLDDDSPRRVGYGNIEITKKWPPEEPLARFVGSSLFAPGKGWAYSQANHIPFVQASQALMVNRDRDADTNEAVRSVLTPLLDMTLKKRSLQ
jgi:hypothetical protein